MIVKNCIYLLTSPSGKQYVGQAIDLKKRIQKYKYGICFKQKILYKAILKHGFDNFKIDILAQLNEYDKDKLNDLEIYFINAYNTFENGYNLTKGGGGASGYRHTEESLLKMSALHKGKTMTIEQREFVSNQFKGKPKTKAHNIKNSLKKIGEKNPRFGKSPSKNQSVAISKANINRRKVYQFVNPDGNIVSFIGLAEFCRNNNLSAGSMCQVYSGKINHHKQWKSV